MVPKALFQATLRVPSPKRTPSRGGFDLIFDLGTEGAGAGRITGDIWVGHF